MGDKFGGFCNLNQWYLNQCVWDILKQSFKMSQSIILVKMQVQCSTVYTFHVL